ncbi:hypothetical protein SKAU_G00054840 [Synaphobranchus kaupii]|uniref:Uncharacterized protein n=1 Tax=Synaphobranchus kaupii TaxID=118154 RepID=A0A9Q1G4S1_SYNKA|nr:hypothetical protein SKAU_G00054840 [Synaphobranchus kaupii]
MRIPLQRDRLGIKPSRRAPNLTRHHSKHRRPPRGPPLPNVKITAHKLPTVRTAALLSPVTRGCQRTYFTHAQNVPTFSPVAVTLIVAIKREACLNRDGPIRSAANANRKRRDDSDQGRQFIPRDKNDKQAAQLQSLHGGWHERAYISTLCPGSQRCELRPERERGAGRRATGRSPCQHRDLNLQQHK